MTIEKIVMTGKNYYTNSRLLKYDGYFQTKEFNRVLCEMLREANITDKAYITLPKEQPQTIEDFLAAELFTPMEDDEVLWVADNISDAYRDAIEEGDVEDAYKEWTVEVNGYSINITATEIDTDYIDDNAMFDQRDFY